MRLIYQIHIEKILILILEKFVTFNPIFAEIIDDVHQIRLSCTSYTPMSSMYESQASMTNFFQASRNSQSATDTNASNGRTCKIDIPTQSRISEYCPLRFVQTGCIKCIRLGCFITQCEKCIQIEKILSTAFYTANYAG